MELCVRSPDFKKVKADPNLIGMPGRQASVRLVLNQFKIFNFLFLLFSIMSFLSVYLDSDTHDLRTKCRRKFILVLKYLCVFPLQRDD